MANSTLARMTLWGLASGSAEIFADIALCPFEMTKVCDLYLSYFVNCLYFSTFLCKLSDYAPHLTFYTLSRSAELGELGSVVATYVRRFD